VALMRIRPDGLELVRAARTAIETAIAPHIAPDKRDTLHAIARAMALAEERLARDAEASAADLAALEEARAAMRGEVLEALPQERQYDARLIAKAIAVATRQLANGHLTERREYERLAALLDAPAAADADPAQIRCSLPALNERLGTRIRAGEADMGTTSYAATLAHLEAITDEALSESNPTYRRPPTGPVPPDSGVTPCSALPFAPVAAALTAWGDVPGALRRALGTALQPAPLVPIDAWLHFSGRFGEALCASGSATLATQADLVGWFAQRLAANPRVPMVAVESAHQAHDLSLAIAEATTAFFELALAPFGVPPRRAEAAKVP
jgi:hypothetical protein